MLQSRMTLSPHIRQYFWDIDPENATPGKHTRYYAARILELGDREAVDWLFKLFGKEKIGELLPGLRLSERSANYWRIYFNLSEKRNLT